MYGAQLYTKRRDLGLSRAKLAKLLGVTERTIVRWEAYARPIPEDVANRLASLSVANLPLEQDNPLPVRNHGHAHAIPGMYWDNRRGHYRRRKPTI